MQSRVSARDLKRVATRRIPQLSSFPILPVVSKQRGRTGFQLQKVERTWFLRTGQAEEAVRRTKFVRLFKKPQPPSKNDKDENAPSGNIFEDLTKEIVRGVGTIIVEPNIFLLYAAVGERG